MTTTLDKIIRLGAAAAIVVSCTVGDEAAHEHDGDGALDLSSGLLHSSRDHLEVCLQVDGALAAQTDELALRLHADLLALRAMHPDWVAAGLDAGEVHVVVGCPGGPLPLEAVDDKNVNGRIIGPGLRSIPSSFRTHVHVLADGAATSVLGDRAFGRTMAELVQVDDHRVAEVSTALVIRVSALGTAEFRAGALAESVGLRTLGEF